MRGFYLLFSFNFLLVVSFLGEANNHIDKSKSSNRVYIVYMGATSSPNGSTRSDHTQLLSKLMKRNEVSVVQTYNKSFLGFAARLSDEEVKSIAQKPGVISVFPERVLRLHTTRSWDFLSQSAFNKFESTPTNVSNCSTGANDTIIGIIDTGIWPESPSFNDKHIGSIPSRWKGICMAGENFNSSTCNRKVIGARYYDHPDYPGSVVTARDGHGHGTHVASTAAGVPIWEASYYGLAKGLARGGSPGSRIAIYRVCGDYGCYDSSILKAFDDAIGDGVDVISVSMGLAAQAVDIVSDTISIGAFHAMENGIIVVAAAGNSGPDPMTLDNIAPWILTVGATTIDRDFEADIILGRNNVIRGGGINFSGLNKSTSYRLVDGRSAFKQQNDLVNASNCVPGSLDDDKVNGKIVLCENKDKDYGTIEKSDMLKEQGAIGMIVIDDIERQVAFKYGTYPTAAVSEEDGARIRYYINSTSNAMATILPTRVITNYKPASVVPFFSSRGPAYGIENLLKPDVVAPGVDILAAWPPFNDSSWVFLDKEPPLFNILSGTSMSCPHVSGLVATIKSWHPTWTPSAIKSAIMTTAIQTNNQYAPIRTNTGSKATPYDMGAGEINPLRSLWPGLVYEIETINYIHFLCNMGYNASVIKAMAAKTIPNDFSCTSNSSFDLISDMNYPSIAVSGLKAKESRTVKRTVTNVGGNYSTYTATVDAPHGMQVQVMPNKLTFTNKVKTLTFQVKFTLTISSVEDLFGSITWSNFNNKVRSPFVVSTHKEKI